MSKVIRRGQYLFAILAVGALLVGSIALGVTRYAGAETDVETDVPVYGGDLTRLAPQVPEAVPPAAPVEEPTSGQGPAASSLPSAGSGGYLDAGGTNDLTYLLIGVGVAILAAGSLVLVYSPRKQ
jgi:hypothetical protein